VAVQTLDADALAAAAAHASDINAALMHIHAALRAAPGPRRPPAQDTPSLKSTAEFTALCKLASSFEANRTTLHAMYPLLYEVHGRHHGCRRDRRRRRRRRRRRHRRCFLGSRHVGRRRPGSGPPGALGLELSHVAVGLAEIGLALRARKGV